MGEDARDAFTIRAANGRVFIAGHDDDVDVARKIARGETLHVIHNYLNFYAFSKFAWDPAFDLDAALAEHHRLMFGAGAGEMAAFFNLLEKLWIGKVAIPSVIGETEFGPERIAGLSPRELWTAIYSPAVLARLRGHLDRAAARVKAGSLAARRIAWIRATFFDPLAVTDAFAENYAGEMRRLAHACGLQLAIEPYGEIPSDDLLYGEHADIPTAEFWAKLDSPHWVRQAASIAHAKGRRIVAAESFTTNAKEGRWQNTPWSMKARCDWVYSEGLNRIIYHRFAHQPWTAPARLPGMTMGPFGVHFDRTQTWWKQAKPWLRYQQRCQSLLQEGTFVADAAWYCPTGYLYINWGHNPHRMPVPVPPGFTYDFISDTTLAEMRVEDGLLVLPSGQRYRTLILPEKSFAPLPASQAGVARLRAAGAEILAFEEAKEALAARTPDVAWHDAAAKLNWIHRRNADADWYFVASPSERPCQLDVSFRTVGRRPELWNPETGETAVVAPYAVREGVTTVRIPFEPCA